MPHSSNSGNDYAKELIKEETLQHFSKILLRIPVYQKHENQSLSSESIPIIYNGPNSLIVSGDELGCL